MLALTPSGFLTVRSPGEEVVPEGTPVVEPKTGVRGRIVRVFGPVARPYVSVRPRRPPTPAEGVALLGATMVRE